MNKNNPLAPFFKGEFDGDLIYSPLKKGARGLYKTLDYYVKMAFFNDYLTKNGMVYN